MDNPGITDVIPNRRKAAVRNLLSPTRCLHSTNNVLN